MSKPHEKLAVSLKLLKELQDEEKTIFQAQDLTRTHRERLIKNGFLKEILKGWFLSTNPQEQKGESTSWYASFWEFCTQYCKKRFDENWCLSAEQSLLIYADSTTIPKQMIIYSPKAGNNIITLLFDSSLYDLKQKITSKMVTKYRGLNLYKLELALLKVSPSFYQNYPLEAQLVLTKIKDITPLLRLLLEGGHSIIAGRIAGAFRAIGKNNFADTICKTMIASDYMIKEINPFSKNIKISKFGHIDNIIAKRIDLLWENNRETVVQHFPKTPVMPKNIKAYLKKIDDLYTNDAYHSLSIEGYQVSEDLIKKVSSGNWQPETNINDNQQKNALAARGYWQVFQAVKLDLEKILLKKLPVSEVIKNRHNDWYRELFQPCVNAGIISAGSLAGYRNHPVYLKNSSYVPPRSEAVFDAMACLMQKIESETNPAVQAVLGHWLIGYIHPYPDGNGRMARFVMNIILTAVGYPWTIVQVDMREDYISALNTASIDGNLKPFTEFIAQQMVAPFPALKDEDLKA